jgi:4a-hydroxytetrahydrobiopterin dehydratase
MTEMTKRQKLSDEAVGAFLDNHRGWERATNPDGTAALARTFAFPDYAAGIAFVVGVGFAAEARDHHPDIHVGWRRVRVVWSTHDAGGITAFDLELAERTDALAR